MSADIASHARSSPQTVTEAEEEIRRFVTDFTTNITHLSRVERRRLMRILAEFVDWAGDLDTPTRATRDQLT